MSYLVLARKYRPRTFTEMVGQEHVVQALTNALTQQRLHHAYLFTGTRGVGKTTVSRILAKSLNCQGLDGNGGITATPCGVCAACTEIDSGRFPDYTELDAASNRGVDEVQSLLEQAVYKPVQGRFKVFMIDEVHMLTNTAFNACALGWRLIRLHGRHGMQGLADIEVGIIAPAPIVRPALIGHACPGRFAGILLFGSINRIDGLGALGRIVGRHMVCLGGGFLIRSSHVLLNRSRLRRHGRRWRPGRIRGCLHHRPCSGIHS